MNPKLKDFTLEELQQEIKYRSLQIPLKGSLIIGDTVKFSIEECYWPQGKYNVLITILEEVYE